jgi:hypothetical protein
MNTNIKKGLMCSCPCTILYTNNNHQEMHKESFIINRNTLLHVSTLLGHLQGEIFVIVTLRLHFIVEWERTVDLYCVVFGGVNCLRSRLALQAGNGKERCIYTNQSVLICAECNMDEEALISLVLVLTFKKQRKSVDIISSYTTAPRLFKFLYSLLYAERKLLIFFKNFVMSHLDHIHNIFLKKSFRLTRFLF